MEWSVWKCDRMGEPAGRQKRETPAARARWSTEEINRFNCILLPFITPVGRGSIARSSICPWYTCVNKASNPLKTRLAADLSFELTSTASRHCPRLLKAGGSSYGKSTARIRADLKPVVHTTSGGTSGCPSNAVSNENPTIK